MIVLLWTMGLLFGAVLLSAIARRAGLPSPSLLAVGGVLLVLIPDSPRISIDPNLVLALFVAPALLDAAFDSSLRDLRQNWLPVASLVFIAVTVTTAGVALVARWLVPAMPWPVAIVLGAAVAPPDAAAATAVLREIRLPHRLLTILEGESLLNDASALLIYRLALGAASAHASSATTVASTLTFVLAGSIAMGIAAAYVFGGIVSRFSHVPSSIVMQFVGAFGVWILADRLELSGVLTIVTFAITLSRTTAVRMPAGVRVPSYAVWEAAVFVLNALAFIMVGLELGPIMDRLGHAQEVRHLIFAAAILATVILARIGWVTFYNLVQRVTSQILGARTPRLMMPPPFGRIALVSWCGMRGIVTLAAVLALPDGSNGGAIFPYRDLIVLTAFAVVLGTLVLQGLTLKPLVMLLGLDEDEPVEREIHAGRLAMFRAALESLGDRDDEVAQTLRREYSQLVARTAGTDVPPPHARQEEIALRAAARTASRRRLNEMRFAGVIGDEAYQQLEAELDLVELGAEVRSRW
jgi:Na+/H+ antiporter